MSLLVSGSLAYDRIMDFPGNFADHIIPEKAHVLSVSFSVSGMVEKFGGTAGNIAYGLSQLGERPLVLSTIGKDYQRYFEWLRKNKISTACIKIVEDEFTAGAYITTDHADNQITAFNPGAMKFATEFKFDGVDLSNALAIVAPGNIQDMMSFAVVYKKKGVPYVFDPGQSIPALTPEEIIKGIEGSMLLIANDYEMELIQRMTGLGLSNLLKMTGAAIVTKGERGSVVHINDGDVVVPAVKPKEVKDPTGAGDAYRAGLLKGLVEGEDLVASARMGAVCAAYAVETYGTQEYRFTLPEFRLRYQESFGGVKD